MYQCLLKEKESKYIWKTFRRDANVRLVQWEWKTSIGLHIWTLGIAIFGFIRII